MPCEALSDGIAWRRPTTLLLQLSDLWPAECVWQRTLSPHVLIVIKPFSKVREILLAGSDTKAAFS